MSTSIGRPPTGWSAADWDAEREVRTNRDWSERSKATASAALKVKVCETIALTESN